MVSTQRVYALLGNGPLWKTVTLCHELFAEAGIPYAIARGVAVCLHGYQRNTTDLDLLIRPADQPTVRELLSQAGMLWSAQHAEFQSPEGIPVQFLLAGDRAGKGAEVRLPDPATPLTVTEIDGVNPLSLARLIEAKLACGQGNLRRTHKDFADVVELIARNQLTASFSRFLHKSLRPEFCVLVGAAGSE